MPPDPNLIVHEVFSWVIPGVVTIVLGFPIVRLITKWLEPRPVPPRELSAINGRLEKIESAVDAIALECGRIVDAGRGVVEREKGAPLDAPFSHISIRLITRR